MENLGISNEVDNELKIFNNNNLKISQNALEFQKIVGNAVNSGINYLLKSIDVDENTKLMVREMLNKLKGVEFKDIISTSITASTKDGLEYSKSSASSLTKLDNFKNMAIKGGLNTLLSAGVDIVLNKFLKGNILGNVLKVFSKDIKAFFLSNAFIQKINQGIEKFKTKVNKFNDLCDSWYKVYKDFDIEKMNEYASKISNYKGKFSENLELLKQGGIIENMTKLINEKKEKLSPTQLEICKTI